MSLSAALIPVFLVIAAGWAARASGVVDKAAWGAINRLGYWVFIPSLLFKTLATAELSGMGAGRFAAAIACGFLLMGVLALALKPLLRGVDGPAYTSVFQGSVRWNGFVVLAATTIGFGPEGAALTALVFAPAVPLVNVLCVGVLSIWGSKRAPSPGVFLARLASNPMIVACLLGAAWSLTGAPTSGPGVEVAFQTLSILAGGALPIMLMCVGAGLNLGALRARRGLLALAVAMKLIVMPAVLLTMARLFELDPLATAVAVAAGASPGAAASYVLAREMGGDADLTAGHVTATTLLAALALPAWTLIAGL